ncbi:unnamed protein product [Acanthoscelides obtectus]|uniref:PiggyBac transposable element-derived protein domain-containing protein n=1 Tax=Acanthoscelides obtectus TaxID=200917 RepID=A0A9P0M2V7_ACAOB|nr:unnamed protein product [Acanthoscelides obtectus]CAK1641274.1 PiggyBac transposable element-derived protein 4 [Acanthoscelides obtectus]
MLEAFRGRCRFRQYTANKPAKYAIKIYGLVDARTFFTSNLEIYAGKQPDGPFQLKNYAASVVLRLIEPISGTGRNVTTDNYFTSVPLANSLLVNHRITTIGTMRKNKPQITRELLDVKNRPVKSSLFAYGEDSDENPNNCLPVSYVPKRNKNVLLLPTLHDDGKINDDTGDAFKPEVITDYDLSKGGVDVVDKMKSEYSTARFSNRWPYTVFCGLLNISTINSQIIYPENTNNIITRRQFISELSKLLVMPHLYRRSQIPSLPYLISQKIRNITGERPTPNRDQSTQAKVKWFPSALEDSRMKHQKKKPSVQKF